MLYSVVMMSMTSVRHISMHSLIHGTSRECRVCIPLHLHWGLCSATVCRSTVTLFNFRWFKGHHYMWLKWLVNKDLVVIIIQVFCNDWVHRRPWFNEACGWIIAWYFRVQNCLVLPFSVLHKCNYCERDCNKVASWPQSNISSYQQQCLETHPTVANTNLRCVCF